VAAAKKPRYVDVSNPSLAVNCPRCGLITPRFLDLCRNCGYKLWPSSKVASAAFQAWRAADPARAEASRFDLEIPHREEYVVDFEKRAHELGIHIFPNSNWPFIICLGSLFLGLAAVPIGSAARIALAVMGGVIFLYGVAGWVLVEDVKLYPSDQGATTGEAQH
jgi:hypothetical protein